MEFDLQVRVMRETYRKLLGIRDGPEADARFLAFCRQYVHVNDERYRTLHAYLASQQDPSPASPTISISSAATSKACTPATAFRTPDASTSAAAHITPQPSTSAAAAASSELNEDQMNTSLEDTSKDRILCPLCDAPLRSGSDDLLVHLQNDHSNRDDEQIPSPPGGNEFTFKGSDGWVRNFLDRHNMHNVLTVGEMGSNNQEASSPKMKEYPEKKEHHNEDRNPVFNQLETHKEHRNECSTEIEQFETDSSFDNENSVDTHKGSDVELDTQSDVQSERNIKEIKGNHIDAIYECFVRLIQLETSNIFNKSSTVDQHKNHDFELDEQSDVELNEQSDGELDIDGICNHLNTLPCTPGGNCSCDTDFTSQIPEYINDYFNMSPDNTIFIVHDGIILKFIVSEDEDFQA